MSSVAEFHTPEEAAIDLEIPLLSTVPSPPHGEGPVAASYPEDEASRRAYRRAADRVLLAPGSAQGVIGILGEVSPALRARVAASLAASIAAERTAILVDGDLRGAFLSFDPLARAQEGLTDVLRFGVRSPRVVAPTQAPGLSLLPVGSDTVDYAGTYASDSAGALFAELRRSGELVLVNGPDAADLESAEPFLDHVAGWILLHDMATSAASKTRRLLDLIGRERCLGLLATDSHGLAPSVWSVPEEGSMRGGADLAPSVGEFAESSLAEPEPRAGLFDRRFTAEPEPAPFRDVPRPVSAPVPLETFEPSEEGAAASFVEPAPAEEEDLLEEDGRRGGLFQVLMGLGVMAILAVAFLFFRQGTQGGSSSGVRPVATPEERLRNAPPAEGRIQEEREGGELGAQARQTQEAALEAEGSASGTVPESTLPNLGLGSMAESREESRAGVDRGAEPSEPLKEELPPQEAPAKPSSRSPAPSSEGSSGRPPGKSAQEPAPKAGVLAGVPASGAHVYVVHVSSLKTEPTAKIEAARIEKAGYPVIVRREEVPGRGTWFRVYAGPYGERVAATNAAGEIRRSGVSDYTQVQRVASSKLETGTGRED
jgi:Mrp family chromosome partitioning ATPase/cell division protein FtsN